MAQRKNLLACAYCKHWHRCGITNNGTCDKIEIKSGKTVGGFACAHFHCSFWEKGEVLEASDKSYYDGKIEITKKWLGFVAELQFLFEQKILSLEQDILFYEDKCRDTLKGCVKK